jgi:hypothetical protein
MPFGDDYFEKILPSYLVQADKTRLKEALSQFSIDERGNEINYSNFYRNYDHSYFMQSDLIREVRVSKWDEESAQFQKGYTDAIIISNTCDISFENKRDFNTKQCLFAPLIDFKEYLADLEKAGYSIDQINSFSQNVKAQLRTNIFYLPVHFKERKEYIVLLDNIFWFPTSELNSYIANIDENRIASFNHFGFYLFILKLSYHLCRLPEQCDREAEMVA